MSTVLGAPLADSSEEVAAPPITRMIMAVLALAGVLLAAYMYLYKIGVLATLTCGAGGCDAVQNSPFAVFLGVPVPLIGLLGYAAILGLAVAGVQPLFVEDRRIAWGLLLFCTIAAVFTIYLNYLEAVVIRAWCRWCIGSAVIVAALFLLSLTEIPRIRRSAV